MQYSGLGNPQYVKILCNENYGSDHIIVGSGNDAVTSMKQKFACRKMPHVPD